MKNISDEVLNSAREAVKKEILTNVEANGEYSYGYTALAEAAVQGAIEVMKKRVDDMVSNAEPGFLEEDNRGASSPSRKYGYWIEVDDINYPWEDR